MSKRVPINRLSKFFGDKDFNLELEMGQEWLYGDMNFTLVLYQVDQSKTKKSNVYGEADEDGIVYKTPVEFKGFVRVAEPVNENVGQTKLRNLQPGNIQISVYLLELEELGIDIRYGDYIGYYETESRVRYYTVVNDGRVTSDNKHTYGGVYPYYRTITAAPVKENEFRGN